ncbi:3-oxoacyl-ACP synthase III family protein [Thalassobellus suaedae]|uniref:Ketoacyl-ACP synthase III n=1 Tax=Thalassobellus suaedae TaxID=3074124 RepID=A0ABY9XQB9_9FLAO|nr:ketoacyl-ACP synthase III [Flavobacteriaceae bacterium HL-DH14]WNH13434.1 ketoacyl-ACP synthase III [Flavobacteriaceae bacterium HL-DH10]
MNIKITGTGSYIPANIEKNEEFFNNEFLNSDGSTINAPNEVIVKKFKAITGIEERRYAKKHLNTSDIASFAAEKAIEDAKINREDLDYIIVAHNYGDIRHDSIQSDTVPSIASRVKHLLRIKNPKCVAYDILFGCPGWVEATIQANAFIKSGIAKKCLVIGAETLSRMIDPHDRDSMIYSDGAGAVVLESTNDEGGIITHNTATYAFDEAHFIYFGETYKQETNEDRRYIKMYGRKIYEFALTNVPLAMKSALDKSGIDIKDVKKILIHQANEKMDEAIVKRFYELYNLEMPEGIMPMSIGKLGNSSVATIPTLYNMILKGALENQEINKGDVIIFASVGAGMNINAIVYKQ